MTVSVHISEQIDRSASDVYAYASQVDNLQQWAAGVSSGMKIRFAEQNSFGVLDHWATVEGQTFYNPMRVIENGSGSEVVFTLRGTPEIDPDDEAAIRADLATLKGILEG
jgi:hypothetical protein